MTPIARAFVAAGMLLLLLGGCRGASAGTREPAGGYPAESEIPLQVFAAASLSDAFQEIAKSFQEKNPGVQVQYNFAGSQQLAQQIVQGAPADVIASANQRQMDTLIEARAVRAGQDQVFARNRLVVIFPKDNPGAITRLQDLAKPGIKVLLAAKEVPAGQYALDFLAKASQNSEFGPGYQESVLKNVVSYEENVRGILSKIGLGEADAGIVYSTDQSSPAAGPVGSLEIPDAFNSIASYPIAPLEDSSHSIQADAFVRYVLSPEGQAILKEYGFLPAVP